jgi:hypothetical protein
MCEKDLLETRNLGSPDRIRDISAKIAEQTGTALIEAASDESNELMPEQVPAMQTVM